MDSGYGGKLVGKHFTIEIFTYIIKDSFHKCNSNFRLLHEIVLGILDL